MPKRRLGYGEITTETKAPASSPLQNRHSKTAKKKSISSRRQPPPRETAGVLLKLSESCNSHLKKCHGERRKSRSRRDREEESGDTETLSVLPPNCQRDLDHLRNLLPQIEQGFLPVSSGQTGPHPDNIAHLCAFYESSMKGLYCPHSSHLFEKGNSPQTVIERIRFLWRHLVSDQVIIATEKDILSEDRSRWSLLEKNEEEVKPIHRVISKCIVQFFEFLADPSIQMYIIVDLIQLLEDSATLVERNVLPVKLEALCNSRSKASIESFDFSLEIQRQCQLAMLQASTCEILSQYLKNIGVKSNETHHSFYASKENNFLPSGNIDLFLYSIDADMQYQITTSLLVSVESILCNENEAIPSSIEMLSRLRASELLCLLVKDWSKVSPTKSSFESCRMIVMKSIRIAPESSSRLVLDYRLTLMELLRLVIIEPLNRKESPSMLTEDLADSQCLIFMLLECVNKIAKKDAKCRDELDSALLMSIHFLLQSDTDNELPLAKYLSNGTVASLLHLLHDSRLSASLSAILVTFFEKVASPVEFNSICQVALDYHTQSSTTFSAKGVENIVTTTNVGVKRKRKAGDPTFVNHSDKKKSLLQEPGAIVISGNSSSWKEALLIFFHDCSAAITKASFSAQGLRKSENLYLESRTIFNTTLFLTLMLQMYSNNHARVPDKKLLCGLVDFVNLSLECILKLYRSQQAEHSHNFVQEQALVDFALFLHFSIGEQFTRSSQPWHQKIKSVLFESGCLAQSLFRNDQAFATAGINSFYRSDVELFGSGTTMALLPIREQADASNDHFLDWRISLFRLAQPGFGQKSSVLAAFEELFALPLGTRCCLLSSLYPKQFSEPAELHSLPDLFVMHSSNLLRLDETLSNLATERIAILCLHIPMYLSSISDANISGQNVEDLLLLLLRCFLSRVATELKTYSPNIARALLYTICEIQVFSTIPEERDYFLEKRFNMFDFLSVFLSPVSHNPGCENSCEKLTNLEVHREIRKVACIISSKIGSDCPDELVRQLRWSSLFRLASKSSVSDIREIANLTARSNNETSSKATPGIKFLSSLAWLVEASFLDANRRCREKASKHLWELLMEKGSAFLLIHFCTEDKIQMLAKSSESENVSSSQQQTYSYEMESQAEIVVGDFFRTIDKYLQSGIGISDSQLSFTMAHFSSGDSLRKVRMDKEVRLSLARSAVVLLGSFCRHADKNTLFGKVFFEKSLQRLVRLWATVSFIESYDLPFASVKSLAFGELAMISATRLPEQGPWWQQFPRLAATVISDILLLNFNSRKEVQLESLETFVRVNIVSDLTGPLPSRSLLQSVEAAFDIILPTLIATFVEEKSLELLHTLPPFRMYIQERIKRSKMSFGGRAISVGSTNDPAKNKDMAWLVDFKDIAKETRELCSEDKILNRLLPLLFLRLEPSGLSFFLKHVSKEPSCKSLLRKREQTVLKGLVVELGKGPAHVGPAKLAIRFAAIARTLDKPGGSSQLEMAHLSGSELKFGKDWVTSQFMFLIANAIQSRWRTRSICDRLQTVRSLFEMLDFLAVEETPQYFVQIMGTISTAILDGDPSNWDSQRDISHALSLRLYAVKCLSKLVRSVMDVQLETIAANLTSIVVALIPIVAEAWIRDYERNCSFVESRAVAVSILEYLTNEDIGRGLVQAFREIPFLPQTSMLDRVHRSLRANGIDFDNLLTISSGTTASEVITGGATEQTEISSTITHGHSFDIDKVLALQKRICLVCTLLDSESTSVRKISLEHLSDVLRGNREIFRKLIDIEGSLSGKRFLTSVFKDSAGAPKWTSRGAVAPMMEKLLSRSASESDAQVKIRLAACIGEVGAISETLLGEVRIESVLGDKSVDAPGSAYRWRLEQPPWQSQSIKYELQLVTKHLVVALKAAPSSTDQHKVAFAIQQLLHRLNSSSKRTERNESEPSSEGAKVVMTKWLKDQLDQSGEMETIEPYFHSDFKEKSSGYTTKKPPFFKISADYFTWISKFSRWMIQSAKTSDCTPNDWKQLFFSCRTAIRTETGLNVAEFLMPLLILERICFGTSEDKMLVKEELTDVFRVENTSFMIATEKQKAVNSIFLTMDTLHTWLNREIEGRSRGRSSKVSLSAKNRRSALVGEELRLSWSAEDAIDQISDLVNGIPLSLQAEAARTHSMNARALQLAEMQARATTTVQIFETSIDEQKKEMQKGGKRIVETFAVPLDSNFNLELMKDVLSRLDDTASMTAIGQDSLTFDPMQQIRDNIRKKDASENFESTLEEYERGIQSNASNLMDMNFFEGQLRCLMNLCRYESVLHQVNGIRLGKDSTPKEIASFAVEAAWKLGKWEVLSNLVDEFDSGSPENDAAGTHQFSTARAMLGLREYETKTVDVAIRSARERLMHKLSSFASEGYSKCYDYIVQLHCLREIEDVNREFLGCNDGNTFDLESIAYTSTTGGWSWKARSDIASSIGAIEVINTRVVIARLRSDSISTGALFLEAGHRARKNGRWSIAESLLSQAQLAAMGNYEIEAPKTHRLFNLIYASQVQLAKLKFTRGECVVALKMLGQPLVDDIISVMLSKIDHGDEVKRLATKCEHQLVHSFAGISIVNEEEDRKIVERFASRLLQLTRWASIVGLKGTSEIISRFELIQTLAPDWEKGHFYFGKFVDSILQVRLAAMTSDPVERDFVQTSDENDLRNEVILRDKIAQTHTLLSMRMYANALRISTKHVYQALPRLLSLWFDLVSVSRDESRHIMSTKSEFINILRLHQNEANIFMASQLRGIPAIAFYTAMPQLISRVNHDDNEAAIVVKSILQRLLIKFPEQAMWPLAWLEGSKIASRREIGLEIFAVAQKALIKQNNTKGKLVEVASNLFEYLRRAATCDVTPGRGNQIRIKAWYHPEIALADFLPPIQAALSVTPGLLDSLNSKNHFAHSVPRMRVFSERVRVMTSKAKPKRMKAYSVAGTYRSSTRQRVPQTATADVDIGELHFLLKQEAKGDLRKDARVQDLNNVINRLMASKGRESGVSSRKRRRLRLRTFAVTCLSEDIGILEWVPDTDSLRNLVMRSYNPQTSESCPRRRGGRLANFSDANLRSHYEMCQNKYFKEGNLSKAASLFEDHCLRPFPPLLWWWFQQTFHDPNAWYEARNRFTLSAAAWSAVGHVIGLGDRHSENILVDTKTGDCVHVDFDCIFDKGVNLPRPEVVPFRLTANMLDAFGPSGAAGIYTEGLQTAMQTLRDNRDTLLSVLEPFVKDPVIDWKRHRSQQRTSASAGVVHTDKQTREAKRSIRVIDERLQGMYNLRNPNLKKYRRRDRSSDQDDEYGHLVPLPVEGQVQRMIQEATSNENLVQLYVGWMPWV